VGKQLHQEKEELYKITCNLVKKKSNVRHSIKLSYHQFILWFLLHLI